MKLSGKYLKLILKVMTASYVQIILGLHDVLTQNYCVEIMSSIAKVLALAGSKPDQIW